MAINDVKPLVKLIATTLAAYGKLNNEALFAILKLKGSDGGADFTDIEAQEFVDQYKVISPTVIFFRISSSCFSRQSG